MTVGGALQHVLAEPPALAPAYVDRRAAIHRHVVDAGLRIVNGRDVPAPRRRRRRRAPRFDYAELRGAMQAVLRGAE